MPYPTLSNVISLNATRIDQEVEQGRMGVYVLDATRDGGFTISYAGRSGSDLNKRLKDWIDQYKFFKFAYCTSAKDAFEAECELYHTHQPVGNVNHPARPTGSTWKCPRCSIF